MYQDLNIRPETISYIQVIATKLMELGLGEDVMNLTPKARDIKVKINEWDHIK